MSVDKHVEEEKSLNFLEEIVENDLSEGKYESIMTRFPQSLMDIYILAMPVAFA
ncbi:hypothetical protein [Niabella hibiscisoli]|nr:hypothetical protein [Niabella hibiscisoli]MCH5714826.1 hypothetical protein [Niabella hibiscisoli]